MHTVAYYAEYHNPDQSITHGVLLLTAQGEAHFLDEVRGTWRTLTREDVPWVVKLGHCPTADAKMIEDADRVRTCSRTLQAA